MKNICFVCYDLSILGGAEKVAVTVANALADRYTVHLVSLTGPAPIYQIDSRIKYKGLGLNLCRLRKGIIPATKALKKYYRENSVDISFLEGNYTGFICCFTSLFSKTKQVFHDHGSLMSQWDRRDIRTIRKIAAKLCDYTMVLTERSVNDYITRLKVKRNKIAYIYNWVDLPDKVAYNSESKTILSVGRFAEEKQFHTVLPLVAKELQKDFPDWRWQIHGDGECFETAKQAVAENGVDGFVQLMGRNDNISTAYDGASVYCLTSNREGLPLVLLEAKAKGVPAVAFDVISGPREIISDGADGFLAEPNNINQMADRLKTLASSSDLREQMSKKCLENVKRFSKQRILEQWIEYIEQRTEKK